MKGFTKYEVFTGIKGKFETYERHIVSASKNLKEEFEGKNILMSKLIK